VLRVRARPGFLVFVERARKGAAEISRFSAELERAEFRGTARYELLGLLGAGSMGVVYEAFDRELSMRIALKCLPAATPEALVRFKSEFRSCQDLHHENLVKLGELVLSGDQLFFTMELVDGIDIISYCRGLTGPERTARRVEGSMPDEATLDTDGSVSESAVTGHRVVNGAADEQRIRSAFAQLTRGLMALHAPGKVHRDVKPSNVLVTPQGRVVLLDFGLVADSLSSSPELRLVGTVGYMAPEQAARQAVGQTADWYSVGLMLFEALSAQLPFAGSFRDVLERKQREPAPPVRSLAPEAPDDLAMLCDRLLERRPEQRPSAPEILSVLEASRGAPSLSPQRAPNAPFVGRDAELGALRQAFAKAHLGEVSIVYLEGQSGAGKTALIRHFLEQIGAERDVLLLNGRCSEREYVPYKAVDGVVDGLAAFAARSNSPEIHSVLERRLRDLIRAFPVFGRAAIDRDAASSDRAGDPHVRRLGLFSAMRELLGRVRAERPVVIALDDMQWADADSLALLTALVRPPKPPAVSWIIASRPHWSGSRWMRTWGAEQIDLGNLRPEHSATLATRLLVQSGWAWPEARGLGEQIAVEAAGHPLFIDELVQQALRDGGQVPRAVLLENALWSRVERLPPLAQVLVKLASSAAGQLSLRTLSAAASVILGKEVSVLPEVFALRSEHLLQLDGTGAASHVEPYHERVGAAVRSRFAPVEERDLHRALATALERDADQDAEALAVHWLGAGEHARAADYALTAADRAAQALAFEHAARLYRKALECAPERPGTSRIQEKLGEALASAGLGAEAASAYLAASNGADEIRRLDLERRAADQLFRSGHIDHAEPLIQRVLHRMGMRIPTTAFWSLVILLLARLRLWFSRLDVRPIASTKVDTRSLMRLDACWSVAVGLSMVDNIRGAGLQSRHLLLALRVRQAVPLSRAIATEASYVAVTGQAARPRVERLLARANELARHIPDPYARGFTTLSQSICSFLMGEFAASRDFALSAERVFEARPAGAMWELASARTFGLWSSFYLGDLVAMRARVPRFIEEAETRGDRYAATLHRTGLVASIWLADDEPLEARRQVLEAETGWSRSTFDFQHYLNTLGNCLIDLYEGAPILAYRRIRQIWPALERSLYLRIQNLRVEAHYVRGVSALAASLQSASSKPYLASAERAARTLERERLGWASALASILRGGIADVRGDSGRAIEHLRCAEAAGRQHGLLLFAAAAAYRRASLVGGDEGQQALEQVRTLLSQQGVKAPDRLCASFAPGTSEVVERAPGARALRGPSAG
jgi:serine/threonine protein kinase